MDPRLQELLDHHEIRKTLADYCQGCDRSDTERMGSVYAEDSWDSHGHDQMPGPEFATYMSPLLAKTTETMSHMLGQSLIAVDGDEAGAETYFLAASRVRGEDDTPVLNLLGGRFVDNLVRTGDTWKIKRRMVTREWTISLDVETDWTAALGLMLGQRSGDDPAFAALGRVHNGVGVGTSPR